MKKLLLLTKTLLVMTMFSVGTNAWGVATRTYDFKTYTESLGLAKNNAAPNTVHTSKFGRISELATSSVDFYYVEDYTYNSKTFYFDNRFLWQNDNIVFRNGGTSALQSTNGNRHIAFFVKAGDTFSFTHSGTIKFANPNAQYDVDATPTTVVAGTTEIVDGTTYTAIADGQIAISFNQWAYLYTVTINAVTEVISKPTCVKSAGEGTNRIVTVTNGRSYDESATLKTYYTTDSEEDPATSAEKVEYTAPIEVSSPTTYYFKTVNTITGVASDLVTVDVSEAGANPDLNAPTATLSGFSMGIDGFYYPVYTFSSDQSGVTGAPEVTYTYSLDGVDKGTATNYWSTGSAILVVTANADGYTSASSEPISIFGGKYLRTAVYNYTEPTKSDFTVEEQETPTGGSAQTINSTGCAFYNLNNLTSTFWEGASLSGFVLAIGSSKGVTQGIYTRTGAGSLTFALSENQLVYTTAYHRSNNADGTYDSYITNYSTGSDALAIPQYTLVYRSEVYSLAPNTVSATIGAKGYTTFSSSYPLNLAGISGGTAYKVITSDIAGTVVTPSAASGTIDAGEGLLLSGEAGATVTIPVAASGEEIDGNLMVGCPIGATITSETANYEKFYVLVNGDTEAKFANLTDWVEAGNTVNIPANKAYLYIPSVSARSMSIVLGDKVTGVENVETATEAKAKEGKFIENGKLVIVKNGQKFNAAGAKLY